MSLRDSQSAGFSAVAGAEKVESREQYQSRLNKSGYDW